MLLVLVAGAAAAAAAGIRLFFPKGMRWRQRPRAPDDYHPAVPPPPPRPASRGAGAQA